MCEWGTTVPLSVTVPWHHSYTGKDSVCVKPIDSCLAPIVEALNGAGILTAGCCCGHGKADGWISLHDGRELVIRYDKCVLCHERATQTVRGARLCGGHEGADMLSYIPDRG